MPLSLAALDELLDSVPQEGPRYIWLTEEMAQRIREMGSRMRQAEALGYQDVRTYERELRKASAIHEKRLEKRLGRWYRLTT